MNTVRQSDIARSVHERLITLNHSGEELLDAHQGRDRRSNGGAAEYEA
jgi:hypothetical protein